jgi:hypothetical protein
MPEGVKGPKMRSWRRVEIEGRSRLEGLKFGRRWWVDGDEGTQREERTPGVCLEFSVVGLRYAVGRESYGGSSSDGGSPSWPRSG